MPTVLTSSQQTFVDITDQRKWASSTVMKLTFMWRSLVWNNSLDKRSGET